MRVKKAVIILIISLMLLWLILCVTDFLRVRSFEMPLFCVRSGRIQEGGSAHYAGLGYSFNIEGNFMPEDEYPGVTFYSFQIFGFPVCSDLRD